MAEIFHKDLIWLNADFTEQNELFEAVGRRLKEKGFVKDTFADALKLREAQYPTGLKTEAYEIAIPHTDTEYVITGCISFVRFQTFVPFSHMGIPDSKIHAKFAFVLCVKDPDKQVEVLSALVKLISDKNVMKNLETWDTEESVCTLLNHYFKDTIQGDNI